MAELLQFKMTKPGMLVHPNVITPKAFGRNPQPDAKKSYSTQIALDPDHPDVLTMKQMAVAAAKAKWPGLDISEAVKTGALRMPWTTGDKTIAKRNAKATAEGKPVDQKYDFLKGKILFKAASDFPIALGVRLKGQGDIDVGEDNKSVHKDAFYTGCSALVGVSYKPYDAVGEDGKPGVKAYLDIVHSLNTGTRYKTGGRSAAEAFKGVAGSAVDESVTGEEIDDEIPF